MKKAILLIPIAVIIAVSCVGWRWYIHRRQVATTNQHLKAPDNLPAAAQVVNVNSIQDVVQVGTNLKSLQTQIDDL